MASSGGNVLLVVAASLLSKDLETFAGFGVAQSLLILAFGTSRAAFGEVLVVNSVGRTTTSGSTMIGEEALPATVLAGMAAGLAGLLLTPLLPDYARPYLLVAAVGCPIILAQDTARYVLFTNDRHRRAAVLDTVWACLTLAAVIGAWIAGWSPLAVVIMWTAAGLAVTLAAMSSMPLVLLSFRSGLGWLRHNASKSNRLAPEAFAATSVVGLPPAIASFAANAEVAVVARVLFASFGVQQIVYAVSLISIGLGDSSPWKAANKVSAIGSLTATVTTALFLLIPTSVGEAVFSAGFAPSREVVIWFGIGQIGAALANGAIVGLRMVGLIDKTAVVRSVASIGAALAASIGAVLAGSSGYAIALAIGLSIYGLAMLTLLWSHPNKLVAVGDKHLEHINS